MIIDCTRKDLPLNLPGLRALADSAQHFYLTGSRFMGCDTEDSDWDFIAQDTPEVRKALADAKFEFLEGDDLYGLEPVQTSALCLNDIIQVALSSNVEVKRASRDVIKEHLYEQHKAADGDERKYLWGALGRVLGWKPGMPLDPVITEPRTDGSVVTMTPELEECFV